MAKRLLLVIAAVVVVALVGVSAFTYLSYGSGTLTVKATDPPVDWGEATQIYLNYSAIEVHRADAGNASGWFTVVDKGAWLNLTKLVNITQTLGSKSLQAGLYNLIRFQILDAIVTVDGENHTATVPSGKLQIAITQGGIAIPAGQTATVLIDLNVKVQDKYRIVPAIRATPS